MRYIFSFTIVYFNLNFHSDSIIQHPSVSSRLDTLLIDYSEEKKSYINNYVVIAYRSILLRFLINLKTLWHEINDVIKCIGIV